jgi:hypothetical protein
MLLRADIVEFGRELRALTRLPCATKAEISAWLEAAHDLRERYRDKPDVLNVVPEAVWHYFYDAAARASDPEYKERQEEEVVEIIRTFERGMVP